LQKSLTKETYMVKNYRFFPFDAEGASKRQSVCVCVCMYVCVCNVCVCMREDDQESKRENAT